MRAAVYRQFGGPDVVRVEELPQPTARHDEVLVRVMASTVSSADRRSRAKDVPTGLKLLSSLTLGFFSPRHRILGMDISGVVAAVGADVTGLRPGDEIIAMLGSSFGGHGEYVTVHRDAPIARKPSALSFEEAAALVFGGITATAFLSEATVTAGASVLVIGASGAVGTAAVQLASGSGARVTAVCSAGNADLVRSLGADRTLDYTGTDVSQDSATYDLIVDCVGNRSFEQLERLIRPGGTLLAIVADLPGILSARGRGRRSGKRILTSAPFTKDHLTNVAHLAAAGTLRPVIHRTFDLVDIAEAHRSVDAGGKRGNVVVRIGEFTGSADQFEK